MYKITKTDYGLHIVMGGTQNKSEIKRYLVEKEKLIAAIEGPFSLLIDLRSAIPPEEDDANRLKESQARMVNNQLQRIAFIVSSPVLLRQARQIGFMSGISDSARFIDASKTPDWKKLSLDWVTKGIEPFPKTELVGSGKASHSG